MKILKLTKEQYTTINNNILAISMWSDVALSDVITAIITTANSIIAHAAEVKDDNICEIVRLYTDAITVALAMINSSDDDGTTLRILITK